ncbi:hypothetical protein V5O48_011383 [Marasmius crinis-equi]|uniref:Uncharacterized protein n=1 Tax=Marasmius crinis-equi TaxID=585013 RepID=A0ABR3F662_9AGAR
MPIQATNITLHPDDHLFLPDHSDLPLSLSMLLAYFPIGEYTPPSHRSRWQIAMNIEHYKQEIWELKFEIWCEGRKREECEVKRDKVGCNLAISLIEVYQEELDDRKQMCRTFEIELEVNNGKREKIDDYSSKGCCDEQCLGELVKLCWKCHVQLLEQYCLRIAQKLNKRDEIEFQVLKLYTSQIGMCSRHEEWHAQAQDSMGKVTKEAESLMGIVDGLLPPKNSSKLTVRCERQVMVSTEVKAAGSLMAHYVVEELQTV